jgi:hypothetical protein
MSDFFDREYTAREAYGRLYQYARKYRGRLLAGLLAGSITAGSWVPIFQVIQPILKQVQRADEQSHGIVSTAPAGPCRRPCFAARHAQRRPEGLVKQDAAAAPAGKREVALPSGSARRRPMPTAWVLPSATRRAT